MSRKRSEAQAFYALVARVNAELEVGRARLERLSRQSEESCLDSR